MRRLSRQLAALLTAVLLVPSVANAQNTDTYSADERSHWSLQPRTRPAVPAVTDTGWAANPIDTFILAKLEQAELRPAPPADRRTLIRRAYFNLLGLPPLPEEIAAFENDPAPDAYERLIDRLLANPHYGEEWGQHWLDVARYSESEGFEYDRHRAGAWRFRDYVIRSLNADKPYDRFVIEQLAGDELPAKEGDFEARIAAGFQRLGPIRRNAGNTDVAFSRNEVLTEMTDAVGAVFLGLTVGCARCHDHMFDAIRQRDYYRLQAFFAAVQEHDVQLGDPDFVKKWNAENDLVQAEIKKIRDLLDDAMGEEREKLSAQLKELRKKAPPPLPTVSSVADDAAKRGVIHVLERGQSDKPKEIVGPRTLGVLLTSSTAEYPADVANPRLLLAQWLVEPAHPLTARVFVNRLWHYQFGQGLVATPNDFGLNGGLPSHPQLLDWLASELVDGGWSHKRVQRLIVTSSTFRQASSRLQSSKFKVQGSSSSTLNFEPGTLNSAAIDPNNRLLSYYSRRRLTAEQLRDSLLAVSGRMNSKFAGESVMPPVPGELVELLYDPAQWQVTADPREHDRRSVYLVAKRNLKLPFMEVFDQPDLITSCARRVSSTHPPQSLELLNGELSNRLAVDFATRLKVEAGDDPARQIERAYWLAAGRLPSDQERKLALEFLREQPLREFALAMFNLNAFLYVD